LLCFAPETPNIATFGRQEKGKERENEKGRDGKKKGEGEVRVRRHPHFFVQSDANGLVP